MLFFTYTLGLYIITSNKEKGGCGENYEDIEGTELESIEEKHLVLSDALLDDTCQLTMDLEGVHKDAFYGDINMVNGVPFPVMTLKPKKYRFRILNGAVTRPFLLKIKVLPTKYEDTTTTTTTPTSTTTTTTNTDQNDMKDLPEVHESICR